MTTTNIEQAQAEGASTPTTAGRITRVSVLAMGAATIANVALYAVAGIVAPEVSAWPGAGVGQIVGATFVYLLTGAAMLAVVNRISSQPARHFLSAATAGLLLSLVMPISAGMGYGPPGTPPAGVATVVTLSLMHVVSYAISVPAFLRITQR